jgi:lipid-binding SYLF domain-containing protein
MKMFKLLSTLLIAIVSTTIFSLADSAKEIDHDANKALKEFYHEVPGGKAFLDKAKGYVVFPEVHEVGFFIGGQYGEGALRVNGITKSYHSVTSLSAGMQMGAQRFSLIVAFTSDRALQNFIEYDDDEWETEFATKIVMADWTTDDGDVDEIDYGASMVGFVYDTEGMIGKFSFEGTKFERINPDD